MGGCTALFVAYKQLQRRGLVRLNYVAVGGEQVSRRQRPPAKQFGKG